MRMHEKMVFKKKKKKIGWGGGSHFLDGEESLVKRVFSQRTTVVVIASAMKNWGGTVDVVGVGGRRERTVR